MRSFKIKAKVWIYPGPGGWHFIYVPDKESKALKELPRVMKRGFGSIKVRAKIGTTSWDTSLFPSKEGPYLLAIKADVRRIEGIDEGDAVTILCVLL